MMVVLTLILAAIAIIFPVNVQGCKVNALSISEFRKKISYSDFERSTNKKDAISETFANFHQIYLQFETGCLVVNNRRCMKTQGKADIAIYTCFDFTFAVANVYNYGKQIILANCLDPFDRQTFNLKATDQFTTMIESSDTEFVSE